MIFVFFFTFFHFRVFFLFCFFAAVGKRHMVHYCPQLVWSADLNLIIFSPMKVIHGFSPFLLHVIDIICIRFSSSSVNQYVYTEWIFLTQDSLLLYGFTTSSFINENIPDVSSLFSSLSRIELFENFSKTLWVWTMFCYTAWVWGLRCWS